jgi:hypothetical protein
MDCPVNPPIKSGEGNDTGKINIMEKYTDFHSLPIEFPENSENNREFAIFSGLTISDIKLDFRH